MGRELSPRHANTALLREIACADEVHLVIAEHRLQESHERVGRKWLQGLVGISGNPALIDGGYTAVPTFGFYEVDGSWGIEGHGVDPDVEVIDDPSALARGGDPQLDIAIQMMRDAIENNPYVPPTRPAAPVRTGMGIEENDK